MMPIVQSVGIFLYIGSKNYILLRPESRYLLIQI